MTDEHLRRSIRAISTLEYAVALVLFTGSVLTFAWLVPGQITMAHAAVLLFIVKFAAFVAVVARSLRKFQPWARTATVVLCSIGLLVIPLGTFLCGPFLYVLVKSKHLFASEPASPAEIDRLAA
jgi:hypothetical protein